MSLLKLSGIEVGFGRTTIVDDVTLSLEEGEIGCLLGPSGCGKTTLLRAIAGFEPLQGGRIELNGKLVSSQAQLLPPEKRGVGMVFQDFALFPHLTVFDNIAFGIREQSQDEQKRRVHQLLEHVGLAGYGPRYPHQLSGGQQQRIALARALAPKPQLLLLDEPFSSLDAELRESLATEVRALLKEEGITALLVTHDQQEAFALADKAGVMYHGRLLQWDTPYGLYHRPAHHLVADFIGVGVLLHGSVTEDLKVDTVLGLLHGDDVPRGTEGEAVDVLIRPDDIVIDESSERRAKIVARGFRGAHFLYTAELQDGSHLICMAPSHHEYQINQEVGLRLNMDHLVLFPAGYCDT
ncbi:ABC transporter ATP-binding protein [Aliidiomarina halalkaliphila]|uniref:ABC transporter ATP-binding protein n=1 Tax=Aliidiomarina halalkaliphila TaxID=2593535 RepID=A0A552X5B7_9GAMM|nr:ABC transporter ATP-binding protein [Aliidiomarina halalkaliphila]TRW50217.1 ABC transporter ATP-binding protein [Aliidiomarina halalkaliphila]